MVLTRSMATTNDVQSEEPPRPIALERQVQTLAAAVERLTKQNHGPGGTVATEEPGT